MSELPQDRGGGGRSGDVGRSGPVAAAALSCKSAKGLASSGASLSGESTRICAQGLSSSLTRNGGTRLLGAAIGLGTGSNCVAEPGLPVLRRESPAAAELEVALREDPGRSAAGGGIDGVHECCTDMLEDADAMDGAAEGPADVVGVDDAEPVREDAAEEEPLVLI